MLGDLLSRVAVDPLIPLPWVIALGALLFIAALLAGAGRLRSYFTRLVAGLFLILALLNPQAVSEEREPLPDTVVIIEDRSSSMEVRERGDIRDAATAKLLADIAADPALDAIRVEISDDTDGTKLLRAAAEGLAQAPSQRLAGVIALTDGQAHDVNTQTLPGLPEDIPFHALIIGEPTARDRRISAIVAPKFGIVGESADFELLVEDPGFEGERARIEVKLNGEVKARFPAIIGKPLSIPLEIERRGSNTVEMSVAAVDGELTLNNNLFVAEISGVRDRMRVLLITGEPHSGGRAWRNLLKSDPALDLVQFTILTARDKFTNAQSKELSLIQFPTQQLFEEKLEEFDLIIFDQYERRSLSRRAGRFRPTIPSQYFQNIVRYVEDGGALLLATGPAFAGENSLYRTPLVSILPTRPTGDISLGAFRPEINVKGARHPITADFAGQIEAEWGQWYRALDNDPVSGHVLMDGPDGVPLFIIDKARKGRVAMLLSDQAWLWAKGHDGGGPYREIFRRSAHWLMGEPDLDAETLSASAEDGSLTIKRRSLGEPPARVTVQYPDGSTTQTDLVKSADGVYQASVPQKGIGAYRLTNGDTSAITAIGALNPKEYARLVPTTEILAPLVAASGGKIAQIGAGDTLPEIRRMGKGRNASGASWMGLVRHDAYTVTQSRRTPLAPGLLLFALFFAFLAWAWKREGA